MATTFSRRNAGKPAPKAYRKFENAYLILLLPGITGIIQGWGLNDAVMNKVLLLLGFSGTVVKAIGYFLANGEEYAATSKFELPEKPQP